METLIILVWSEPQQTEQSFLFVSMATKNYMGSFDSFPVDAGSS